ncbi:unnamed protein product, partial [Discosporangium mesarthrocarpum]
MAFSGWETGPGKNTADVSGSQAFELEHESPVGPNGGKYLGSVVTGLAGLLPPPSVDPKGLSMPLSSSLRGQGQKLKLWEGRGEAQGQETGVQETMPLFLPQGKGEGMVQPTALSSWGMVTVMSRGHRQATHAGLGQGEGLRQGPIQRVLLSRGAPG